MVRSNPASFAQVFQHKGHSYFFAVTAGTCSANSVLEAVGSLGHQHYVFPLHVGCKFACRLRYNTL
jgi:hypothetical protein